MYGYVILSFYGKYVGKVVFFGLILVLFFFFGKVNCIYMWMKEKFK